MTDLALTETYDFAPSIGECVLNALSRDRIRGPMVKAEHMRTATMEANLMQVEWGNRGPNLWAVSETIIDLVQGQATYPIDPATIMVLNVTIGVGDPPSEQELTISPVSRTIYSMYPNKMAPGRPTSYWFDRTLAPSITLWPVPDQPYAMHYWTYRQQMDASARNAGNFEVPWLWLDAACAGLAFRLARHYAQDLEQQRNGDYEKAYTIAATQNVEADGMVYITPMITTYFR
jgi:hypothetical protein